MTQYYTRVNLIYHILDLVFKAKVARSYQYVVRLRDDIHDACKGDTRVAADCGRCSSSGTAGRVSTSYKYLSVMLLTGTVVLAQGPMSG